MKSDEEVFTIVSPEDKPKNPRQGMTSFRLIVTIDKEQVIQLLKSDNNQKSIEDFTREAVSATSRVCEAASLEIQSCECGLSDFKRISRITSEDNMDVQGVFMLAFALAACGDARLDIWLMGGDVEVARIVAIRKEGDDKDSWDWGFRFVEYL